MKERVYARLNLWDNQLLDHLNLGVSFFQVNQIGSPKDVKLDRSAKACREIERTMRLVYCNSAYVKQSGFTQEELLVAPNTASLNERVDLMTLEMAETWWNNQTSV